MDYTGHGFSEEGESQIKKDEQVRRVFGFWLFLL